MAIREPKNPEYLYKYRSLSSLRYILDILIYKRLYGSPIADLNDPMEGKFKSEGFQERELIDELYKKRSRTRICSLSSSNDNYLMWSHYADGHKGICIKLAVTSKTWTKLDIVYTNKILGLNPGVNRTIEDILSVKSPLWKYENEVRFIKTFENDKNINPFISCYIDAIYLGNKMNSTDEAFYTRLFKSLVPNLKEVRRLRQDELKTGFV